VGIIGFMVYQDRVASLIVRRCVFGRDRGDILTAIRSLGVTFDDDIDHPLVDLYKGLCFSKDSEMLYLFVEHCSFLKVSLGQMSVLN
jgi:hypothetical protein